jgi:hypothetical protein
VGFGPTPIVTERDTVPPMPEQSSVNVAVFGSGVVVSFPVGGRVPLHAPLAVQLVASVLAQVSRAVAFGATPVAFALRDNMGAGTTLTLTVRAIEPPCPEHVSVNAADFAIGPMLAVPLAPLTPDHAPLAVQLVALLADQSSCVLPCAAIAVGVAVNDNAGRAGGAACPTVTVADCATVPPSPVHVSV